MLSGELYDPLDHLLCAERQRARGLLLVLNETREAEQDNRAAIIRDLFGARTDVLIQPPFFCDYGTHILVGEKVFFNVNCVVLDVMPVTIGSFTLFGPAVQVYTATHPLNCLLYTSDAADDLLCVDLGGRRIIKKKKTI